MSVRPKFRVAELGAKALFLMEGLMATRSPLLDGPPEITGVFVVVVSGIFYSCGRLVVGYFVIR